MSYYKLLHTGVIKTKDTSNSTGDSNSNSKPDSNRTTLAQP